jgi:hypothetical protein
MDAPAMQLNRITQKETFRDDDRSPNKCLRVSATTVYAGVESRSSNAGKSPDQGAPLTQAEMVIHCSSEALRPNKSQQRSTYGRKESYVITNK